jgi:hypothetical protein
MEDATSSPSKKRPREASPQQNAPQKAQKEGEKKEGKKCCKCSARGKCKKRETCACAAKNINCKNCDSDNCHRAPTYGAADGVEEEKEEGSDDENPQEREEEEEPSNTGGEEAPTEYDAKHSQKVMERLEKLERKVKKLERLEKEVEELREQVKKLSTENAQLKAEKREVLEQAPFNPRMGESDKRHHVRRSLMFSPGKRGERGAGGGARGGGGGGGGGMEEYLGGDIREEKGERGKTADRVDTKDRSRYLIVRGLEKQEEDIKLQQEIVKEVKEKLNIEVKIKKMFVDRKGMGAAVGVLELGSAEEVKQILDRKKEMVNSKHYLYPDIPFEERKRMRERRAMRWGTQGGGFSGVQRGGYAGGQGGGFSGSAEEIVNIMRMLFSSVQTAPAPRAHAPAPAPTFSPTRARGAGNWGGEPQDRGYQRLGI